MSHQESPICETLSTCLSDERHHWLSLGGLWWDTVTTCPGLAVRSTYILQKPCLGHAGITSLARKGPDEHSGPSKDCLVRQGATGDYQHPSTKSMGSRQKSCAAGRGCSKNLSHKKTSHCHSTALLPEGDAKICWYTWKRPCQNLDVTPNVVPENCTKSCQTGRSKSGVCSAEKR